MYLKEKPQWDTKEFQQEKTIGLIEVWLKSQVSSLKIVDLLF